MGYAERQQSNSAMVVVGVVLVVLVIGLLLLVAAGAGWFLVRSSRVEMQRAIAVEERAVAATTVLMEEEIVRAVVKPDLKATLEVTLDRDGNTKVEGEEISLGEIRARLVKLKKEGSKAFSVEIQADSECPVKFVVSVTDICRDVGDIDYTIATSATQAASTDESNAKN